MLKPVPETVPEDDKLVKAPVFGVLLPIGPGDVRSAPAIVLHPNPLLVVHVRAEDAALHDGTASEATFAVPAVALPSNVLVPLCTRFGNPMELAGRVTVPVADRLVNEPAAGVTPPMAGGLAR